MTFYNKLYTDETIDDIDSIIFKLSNGISIFNLYLICLSCTKNNIFEVFESNQLFKPYYKKQNYFIIGIVFGKENAINIVKQIFQDYIKLNLNISKIKEKFLLEK